MKTITANKSQLGCHILRRNCLLHDIKGQMTEVKGVRRRRTQLLILEETEDMES